MKKGAIIWVLILTGIIFVANTAAIQIYDIGRQEDYTDSIPRGISIDPDGRLSVSGLLEPVWESTTDAAGWTVETDNDSVYLATADDGKVYRYKNEKMELLFDSPQIAILSLLSIQGQGLFAGSAPDGIVYKIDNTGMASVFFRTDTSYVWQIISQDRNTMLLATGLPASIIRVTMSGERLDTIPIKAAHVRTAVQDSNGGIWLGTADPARIYHLDGNDLQLVYEAAATEISAMASCAHGIWFSTVASPTISDSWSERAERLRPGISHSTQQAAERSSVWFIDNNRSIYEVWSTTATPIFDMVVVNNKPYVVCGGNGYLLRIDDIYRSTVLAMRQSGPLTSLAVDPGGVLWAGGATDAGLFRFDGTPAEKGSIESEVIDAGIIADWGRLIYQGHHLSNRTVKLFSRTGNTKIPDDEWSHWVQTDDAGKIMSPPGRCFQWKAHLTRHRNRHPVIETVSISYKTTNRPPYIRKVTVHPVVKGELIEQPGRGRMFQQTMPDGLRIEFVLPASAFNGLPKGTWMQLRGMRTISWEAGDPDNDPLIFRVEISQVAPEPQWLLLADNLSQPVYSFDSTAYSDGWYRVRVTASDKSANPLGDTLTAERVSLPFEIDNTPPFFEDIELQVLPERPDGSKSIRVTGKAVDKGRRISRLEYSLDNKQWFDFSSVDGILDQSVERFEITLDIRPKDQMPHQIFLRITDHHENVATKSVVVN